MKIGILTGGGDAPGLNPVIRAVVRRSLKYGHEIIGFKEGWRGLLEKKYVEMDIDSVSGILHRGGTILGTSRTNVYKIPNGEETIKNNLKELGIDALVAIGGEDTLGVANKLHASGIKVVGVPKTIDNDLNATDFTFGFDTAVNIATEAIDRLHTTAESHNRVMVVEVMGRHAGWIAWYAGVAGGADYILVPEKPFTLQEVCDSIKKRHERGKTFSIIVVSEGAKLVEGGSEKEILQTNKLDSFGHVRLGGIANILAEEIEKETGFETRATILGHIQRGGTPTAFDRVLGTRLGVFAAELVNNGQWGMMAALRGTKIIAAPLAEAVGQLKTLDLDLMDVASTFFG